MSRVIKLGGSLLEAAALADCLAAIAKRTESVVIVPGGGPFAEQVRVSQSRWHFDDVTAHRMAILAMQQMALLMHNLQAGFVLVETLADLAKALTGQQLAIWSPQIVELDAAGIPASWDISSDSLAAWLAGQLGVQNLLLVKSAPLDEAMSLDQLQTIGMVDAAFDRFVADAEFSVTVMNKDRFLSSYD